MKAQFPAVSADFIIDLYHQYLRDPSSVDSGWKPYFDELYGRGDHGETATTARLDIAAAHLLDAYRQRGYLNATLDPLSLRLPAGVPDLLPNFYGLDEASLDLPVQAPMAFNFERGTLRELLSYLQAAYAESIGFDCAHVQDSAARNWLYLVAEQGTDRPNTVARRAAGERIVEADTFEQFMNRRFPGKKRFGAEGCEALLPWFDAMLARSAALGVKDVVIGGTARGRLNVMANIIGKPIAMMFREVKGHRPFAEEIHVSGDVPYHFGYSGTRHYGDASLSLLYCHNPSHLEAIDAVTSGRVRARQRLYQDARTGWREVLGVTVHTDAAFAGQGVVAEVLQLSRIPAYRTGGTIRVVIDNQVGFTTNPVNGRSSTFCTDVAKTIGAPILHVNADNIDAVVRCAFIAAEYRHRFNADVVVDLICYRRRGHNEVDEPAFTQPIMYQRINDHPPVRQAYVARLVDDGVFSQGEIEDFSTSYFNRLNEAYEAADSYRPNCIQPMGGDGTGSNGAREADLPTGIPLTQLRNIGLALATPPPGLSVNPKIIRQLQARERAVESGEGISWAFAEALAYGSLACEGTEVRVSGQDTPRGAFSQRHFVLFDQETGAAYEPLNNLQPGQARCEIIGSPLSEYAVLGFEYGYTLDAKNGLSVWEAQFGDFANVAQVIIDQFIASGEDKWLDESGLTLLLPHGLEGQGPDHSSGRIERFLQLAANGNMRIANCTTPANFFHLLRSQAFARPRRPLIVFTPKSLLRHKELVSRTSEFLSDACYRPVIGPETTDRAIRRVVVCSGKVYYDVTAKIAELAVNDVAVIRLEQLFPFPENAMKRELARFPGTEIVWLQEEPRNMGPWTYIDRRLEKILGELGVYRRHKCVSRPENASTAIGTTNEHDADQDRLAALAAVGDV